VGPARRRVGIPVLVGLLALLVAGLLAFSALDRRSPADQAEVAADVTPGTAAGDPAAAGAEPTGAEAAAPADDAAAAGDNSGEDDEGSDSDSSGQGNGGNNDNGGRGNAEDDPQAGQEQAAAAPGGVEVPADFVTFTSPDGGWSIRHPPGWTVQDRAGTPLDLVEPGTGRYLRVDYRRPPGESALGAWQEYEPAYAANHSGYRQIRMEQVTYRDFDAADWEYTYTSGGATLHAVNRGMIARGDGILESGYALNFQTREADWERSRELFEQLAAAFQPAPAP
jgi:hypothetical protein